MKKVLIGIGIALALLIIVVVGGGFALPAEVSLSRDIVIDAPAEDIYPHVSSFQGSYHDWSPWSKIDPNTKYEYSGPDSGVGAKMEWTSEDPNVGNGSQEITSATPNERVESALAFEGQPPSRAVFILEPQGEGKTKVTWEFHGDMGNNPIGRWFGLMMEDFLGPDYEKGLSNLKGLVESA